MSSIYDDEFDMIVDDTIEEHIDDSILYIHITLFRRLEEYLMCNSIKKNIEIINEFGGIYKNLKKFNDESKWAINMEDEADFYVSIALTAVKEFLLEKLEIKVDG